MPRRLLFPLVVVSLLAAVLSVVGVTAPAPMAGAAVPAQPSGAPAWPGWDIARAIAITPAGTGGMVLDGYGGLHRFGLTGHAPPPPAAGAPSWPGLDIARGVALTSARRGYVLDGLGGIHPFGGATRVNPAAPGPSWTSDLARGITVLADRTGGYVLDALGGMHPFGLGTHPAPPPLALGPSWSFKIGADIALLSDGTGGFVLDGLGGVQHVGHPSVVPSSATPSWPGWDIARGIALLPDRTGGYVLDGYGGIHAFALGNGAPQIHMSVLRGGLQNPWDLGFTPDGWIIYTERPNGISAMRANGTSPRLMEKPTDLLVASEAGMMGLALDPNFASNRRIYTCFGSNLNGNGVRLVRWTVNASYTALANRTDLFSGAPINPNGQLGRHSGCRPRFGPDGNLWVGTGDSAVGTVPQDLDSLGGKVLHMDTDGNGVAGNPFLGQGPVRDVIWSYGHRNVQGVAFAPGNPSWRGYSVEHGPDRDDEVNRLATGNFGWNPIPVPYNEAVPMTDHALGAVVDAVWSSGFPTIAPSGSTFLTGNQWHSWNGAFAVAVLKGSELVIFFHDSNGAITGASVQLQRGVRLRSAVQGPNGDLYISTDARPGGDQVWRIRPN